MIVREATAADVDRVTALINEAYIVEQFFVEGSENCEPCGISVGHVK